MTFATVQSCTLSGVNAIPIIVEVHTSQGLPSVNIVGLPQSAVRESKDRVRAAILNTGFDFPLSRVTVNLAPADLPKQGGRFDLPIALGIMLARGQIPPNCLDNYCVVGELGLDGELRAVNGTLPTALKLGSSSTRLLCPAENLSEAQRGKHTTIVGAYNLRDVVSGLCHESGKFVTNFTAEVVGKNSVCWVSDACNAYLPTAAKVPQKAVLSDVIPIDFSDVKGQAIPRRVLEIAAAGSHNVLMMGPPGTGKSMLASRLPTILPPMSEQEALESASIASLNSTSFDAASFGVRPYRAPHHSTSTVGLIGGGYRAMPGEISLAHHGVLFLDELNEFPRRVLDALREPLESGVVHLSRLAHRATYPAQFQFVGAANPCACGYHGDAQKPCVCTQHQLQLYRSRLSGPLLDRMDLQVAVERTDREQLLSSTVGECSSVIRQRVVNSRAVQVRRQGVSNQHISASSLVKLCAMKNESLNFMNAASTQLNLSHRATHRTLRVARTIADLSMCQVVEQHHIAEALSYRMQPSA